MKRWSIRLLCLALTACGADDPAARDDAPGAPEDGPSGLADGKADGLSLPSIDAPLPAGADLDAPFAALFAPDDPTLALELALIDRVVDKRASDANRYADGENPFAVRYAVYNLRNTAIVERLADAADQGVDVQILIHGDQLDPARDYNTTDEYLVGRGFTFAADRDALDAKARRTTDLIGVNDRGLMHLKTRLYEWPRHRAVLSGSENPGDNALANEETLHLINDPRLTARYAAEFEAVRGGERLTNAWDEGAGANVLFTPEGGGPRAGTKLLEWLADEDEQILLMVFSLRDIKAPGAARSLLQILGDKAKAGVPVYLITDRKQSDGVDAAGNHLYRDDDTEDRLRRAGVHVYEATNRRTEFTAMHHKVAILGRTKVRVVSDAANWSFAALGSDRKTGNNVESMLFLDTEALDGGTTGRRYLAQWLRVLERYADESARDGEPSFEKVRDALLGAAGWPTVPVTFVAHDTYTEWGQVAAVQGDVDALGAWGEAGPGLTLGTDGDRYPTWMGATELPVGQTFAWKLSVLAGDDVRWERGADRAGRAQSTALLPTEQALHEGDWR